MEATFFVATNGDDGWSGTLAEPNADGTDGPFSTLVRARDAVRHLRSEKGHRLSNPLALGHEGPITVMVRGGKYFLEETLVLNPIDGGTREYPTTYTAYPGEKPVLSGGVQVMG